MMHQKKNSEQGMSLIEISLSLTLVAVVITGITTWMSSINEQLQLRGDAKHFSLVAKAAELYVKGDRGTLIGDSSKGIIYKQVSIDDMKKKGYLAPEIESTLGKKQQTMVLAIKLNKDPALFQALLYTTGGTNYTNAELGTIVNMAEASVGFMDNTNTPIRGFSGSWETPASGWSEADKNNPSPGHLAAFISTKTEGSKSEWSNSRWSQKYYISGQTYTNNYDSAITISSHISCGDGNEAYAYFYVDGVYVSEIGSLYNWIRGGRMALATSVIVPPKSKYVINFKNKDCDKMYFAALEPI